MKQNRLSAIGAALALLVGSIALATPAVAADIAVPDGSFGVEGSSYPDGWFTGNPQPAVAPVDNATGVTLTGITQLLHGGIIPITTPAAFTTLVEGSAVDADGLVTFQYPIFFNSDEPADPGFTTLRPVPTGTPSASGTWVSSRSVIIDGNTILSQGEHTWDDIISAFGSAITLGREPEVLAVGVFVDAGQTALVRSISFGGDTHDFDVTPITPVTPVAPVAPVAPVTTGARVVPVAPVAAPITTRAAFTG